MLLGSRKIDLSQTLDKHGCSALHCAAYGGKISTVRALIEHGAEVDAREGAGLTPLHKAVLRKMQGTVKVLLEFGADPLAVTKRGASAIDLAMKDGLVDILHLLEDAIEEE
ncbi:ankyrin repeat protein [Melanomma pulvis-pyrius CBS 109.77]|uniref:Ankyrin repeat protein n=1 Tax=Melanomma pulvis-pyrius CBS 109.77 TaxID=1314802 RepID=A0A6A6XG92_9PLEO|nr:ankyrin repeat protein [Melanomma pulvis-pyrius CBS 109.77]